MIKISPCSNAKGAQQRLNFAAIPGKHPRMSSNKCNDFEHEGYLTFTNSLTDIKFYVYVTLTVSPESWTLNNIQPTKRKKTQHTFTYIT